MSEDSRRLKDFLASRPLPTLRILVLVDRDPTEDGQHRQLIELFLPEEGRDFRVEWTTNLGDPKEMIPGILQQMSRDSEAYVLLHRTSDRATFESAEELWQEHVAGKTDGDVFLVANGQDGGITLTEGKHLADRLQAAFWPLSAKTGSGTGEGQLIAMATAILLRQYRQG